MQNSFTIKDPKIALVVQKLRQFYWRGGFCLLVELHWEGSAPPACPAGLFLNKKHSHFTPKCGAPRWRHHSGFLNGWKILSSNWYITKKQYLQMIWWNMVGNKRRFIFKFKLQLTLRLFYLLFWRRKKITICFLVKNLGAFLLPKKKGGRGDNFLLFFLAWKPLGGGHGDRGGAL